MESLKNRARTYSSYVPVIPSDERNTLDKTRNAAFDFCQADYFLAYKEGRLVGRVAAILNPKANQAWNTRTVRFGWIDFTDDYEVSEALQKCGGHLFPTGWWHLLKNMYIRKPDTLDLLLIGVRPDYRNKGVIALIFNDLFHIYKDMGFKYAETSAELESNLQIQQMFSILDPVHHKRRRVYTKQI